MFGRREARARRNLDIDRGLREVRSAVGDIEQQTGTLHRAVDDLEALVKGLERDDG